MSDQEKWKGRLTDTNKWYRDSKDPMYNTKSAYEHRIKMDIRNAKAQKTKAKNKEIKARFHAEIGDELVDEVVSRVQRLTSDFDYGLGKPTHKNYKGKEYPSYLSKSHIYQHMSGSTKIYYTAQPYQMGSVKRVMVTLDSDNPGHKKNTESDAALKVSMHFSHDMQELGAYILTQPSTNNGGYHQTICIDFPFYFQDFVIRRKLAELRTAIAEKYKSYGCKEVCLKGVNFVSYGDLLRTCGTLVKLPSISNQGEAFEFLAMTDASISFSSLAEFFSLTTNPREIDHEDDKDRNSSVSSQTKNADSVSSSLTNVLDIPKAGTEAKLSSCVDKLPLTVSKTRSGKHKWNENDPLGRMYKAASHYCHMNQRHPSAEELVAYYELLKYHTGKAEPDRLQRAKKAVQWVQANHNFTLPSEQRLYDKWFKFFKDKNYSKDEMTYSGSGRYIRFYHLALVASVIERKELEAHKGGLAHKYFITISREKNRRKEIGFKLDGNKVSHCIHLMEKHQVIEVVKPHTARRGGVYRINHEQLG